ncbi:zinc finger protein 850-like isoform X2 [Pectinophora gossypiella]|nr:zinc finger protein 850-like isoform X2 [Pectinophora gossypiella]XP_049884206.1 zinc finger protein 850-like isoform X2 [Pectinophora gossypiella]
MAGTQQHRFVNVVPNVKIKKEVLSSDDENCVSCRICNKSFASDMALRNHARMEHIDAYATGDPSSWTQPEVKKPSKESQEQMIKLKTEKIISSMAPADLMTLASDDVSYIIIKAENPPESQPRKRKSETEKVEKVPAKKDREKEKEVRPITGPFECLQPSTLVADGTCHQIFFSCCEYSAHFRDEHTRRRKGLRCQVCEKPLVASYEPLAPYSCVVCGAGFQTSKELSDHKATDHIKLKPFQCGVCLKRFTQQGGVQQHMRMHTGDRPFHCTFCPKSFTQKSGLDQHLRIHTKMKPYRCVICSKSFCQSVHLRQHMRTHTNVSPFQCGICQKRFKQSSHLNYHLKNHNQVNMTEDQKTEYKKLISLMNLENKKDVYVYDGNKVRLEYENQVVHEQEIEGEQMEMGEEEIEQEVEEEVETVEAEVLLEEQETIDDEEQILAEQSIQVQEEGGETYILGDVIYE